MSSLFAIRGNDQGARYELEDPSMGIGRDPSNLIQLHDTEVSRRHAEVRRAEDGTFDLVDLGSSNGTYVNNRRITEHKLESGDEVRIGSTVMLYKGIGDDTSASLADKIDIISSQKKTENGSKILQSLSPTEGSSIFATQSSESQSPWLTRAISNLEVMYRTALAVSHTLDIDQLLGRIMQLIFEWVEADRGCIMLLNNDTRKLEIKAVKVRRGIDEKEKIRISNTIVEYVLKNGQGVLTSDAQEDSRWNPAASILQHNIREAICVPMQGRHNNMVGLIYIDTSTPPERIITHGTANKFSEEHLKLMIAIGHQAAMAVEDTRYYGELMQAERLAAVGQTIATLSHHIKNILQGIRGGSYLIEMGLSEHEKEVAEKDQPDPEKLITSAGTIRKGWDIVDKNQNKISALVMDMLTFSKEREPALEDSDLNQVTHDVVELMETRARDLDADLEWNPSPEMPDKLVFDPEGLHRAILNVVTNALDACSNQEEHRGKVTVSTAYGDGTARVLVEDNGVGIPPEEIEKIFILFNSSKKGGRGTGLGLSVSNKILHEHGGKIDVESHVGKGSRFILMLPAVLPDAGDSEDNDAPPDAKPAKGLIASPQTSTKRPPISKSDGKPAQIADSATASASKPVANPPAKEPKKPAKSRPTSSGGSDVTQALDSSKPPPAAPGTPLPPQSPDSAPEPQAKLRPDPPPRRRDPEG